MKRPEFIAKIGSDVAGIIVEAELPPLPNPEYYKGKNCDNCFVLWKDCSPW